MTRRIPVDQVTLGLRITGLDKSWFQTPFLRHRLVVKKPEQIELLKAWGVRFVDVDDSPEETKDGDLDALEEGTPPASIPAPPGAQKTSHDAQPPRDADAGTFEQELASAKEVYREANQVVERCFDDVRMGRKLRTEEVRGTVEGVVDAALRNLEVLTGLARMQAADGTLFAHCVGTSVLAIGLGVHMGFSREELHGLGVGVLLHDIGKVTIPESILSRRGRWSPSEYALMKEHVQRGADLVAATPDLPRRALYPVLEHHERADGSGFPQGRRARQLSREGQICGIANLYEHLTAPGVPHRPLSPHKALQELYLQSRRGQFDEYLIEHFIQCLGVYPVGSCVMLDSGETGLVYRINRHAPLTPRVLVIKDALGRPLVPPAMLDLTGRATALGPNIVSVIDPYDYGINPTVHLEAWRSWSKTASGRRSCEVVN